MMTEDQLEHFNERAAIMQYDGGMAREDAEKAAMQEVVRRKIAETVSDVRS